MKHSTGKHPTPLTVMQVLPALHGGGVERGTIEVAAALTRSGHRAIVVSSGGPMVNQLDSLGALHITLPVHSKNPLVILNNARRLVRLIKQHRVDAIHVRSRAPAWSVYWASRSARIPMLSTFHGAYGHASRVKRWYNRIMLSGDLTIAVSDYIYQHIHQVYPPPETPVVTIRRGVDLKEFDPGNIASERIDALRKRWQIAPDKTVILLPGRLTRLKGHQIFIEAIAQLQREDICCLIIGGMQGHSSYVESLQTQISDMGLNRVIRMVGHCEDMPAALALANIVVSASTKAESFGRTVCEAQAMGRLIVATRHGGSLETVAPCQRQGLCQPNDVESLRAALEKQLTLDDGAKKLIAAQSRQYIRQRFALETMTDLTLACYRHITSERGTDGHSA